MAEVAQILGWSKQKVSTYRARGVFPKPIQQLSSGPIWLVEQIEQYNKSKSL